MYRTNKPCEFRCSFHFRIVFQYKNNCGKTKSENEHMRGFRVQWLCVNLVFPMRCVKKTYPIIYKTIEYGWRLAHELNEYHGILAFYLAERVLVFVCRQACRQTHRNLDLWEWLTTFRWLLFFFRLSFSPYFSIEKSICSYKSENIPSARAARDNTKTKIGKSQKKSLHAINLWIVVVKSIVSFGQQCKSGDQKRLQREYLIFLLLEANSIFTEQKKMILLHLIFICKWHERIEASLVLCKRSVRLIRIIAQPMFFR